MAKKERSFGIQTWTPPGVRVVYYSSRYGTWGYVPEYAAGPTISRRIGNLSSIISQTGDDGRFRPCVHTQEQYTIEPLGTMPTQTYFAPPSPINNWLSKGSCWGLAAHRHAVHYASFTSGVNAASASLDLVQWSSLAAQALDTMLPSFHSKSNMVNFFLELRDFKRIFKYTQGRLIGKANALEAIGGFNRLDRPFKKLSKSYLSYQFGWRPLFNDIVSAIQVVSGFHQKFWRYIQENQKPQQSYYGVWIPGTESGETIHWSNSSGNGPVGGWYGPWAPKASLRVVLEKSQGVRYHATCRYRYQIPDELRTAAGKTKAFLDALGVSQNPATIWNAIPYTFLIDWVVNVGSYLDRLRVDNVPIKTEILDFCHSARVERAVRYEVAVDSYKDPGGGVIPGAFQVTDRATKIKYERKLGIPDFRLAIQTSGLNPRELLLGGALVGANRKG